MMTAGLWLAFAAAFTPSHAGIVVAYESGVDAYGQTLEGIRAALAAQPPIVIDLHSAGGADDLARALAARETRVIVAVGARALQDVQVRKPAAPVLAALVLRGKEPDGAGHVDLDIALPLQLGVMKALLPKCTRAGMIRNPQRCRYTAEALAARARKEGYTAEVVDCDGPAHLLKTMAALKGKVDFVLCSPDPDLYNPVTIKPLVLASLESRLPLVGFSPAFVRAGAVAGIYPDYRDVGRQVAELALRAVRGEDRLPDEGPAKINVAVNQRVARLLGLDPRSALFPVEVFR
jgi:putative tryptophan/tyrosine transport system substrate-binding protein